MLICILLLVLIALVVFLWWQNSSLTVNHITFSSPRFPAGLDGYTLLQVSDLHSKRFGRGQRRLLRRAADEKPACIVITGDLISRGDRDFSAALDCVKGLAAIAPAYFVPGNHEADLPDYARLGENLTAAGAVLLENRRVEIRPAGGGEGDTYFHLLGVADPLPRREAVTMEKQAERRLRAARTTELIKPLLPHDDGFCLLLLHHPELWEPCAPAVDLTVSGHAHGGQVRLPGLPGLFAPGQGALPPYTAGLYREGERGLVVSRGLGGKKGIPRIFNRPELVSIRLCHGEPIAKNS